MAKNNAARSTRRSRFNAKKQSELQARKENERQQEIARQLETIAAKGVKVRLNRVGGA